MSARRRKPADPPVEKKHSLAKDDGPPPWAGPPGCTCDLTRPPRDRCSKGGWLRCQGALNAMWAQMHYRDEVGRKGGKAKRSFLHRFTKAQKETGQA